MCVWVCVFMLVGVGVGVGCLCVCVGFCICVCVCGVCMSVCGCVYLRVCGYVCLLDCALYCKFFCECARACVYVCECASYTHACVVTSTALEHLTHPPLSVSNTRFASNISNTVSACVGPIAYSLSHRERDLDDERL